MPLAETLDIPLGGDLIALLATFVVVEENFVTENHLQFHPFSPSLLYTSI